MPRIDLKVPFAEKDEAKRLGARWDASRKVWFAPDGVAPDAFWRWMPIVPWADINVRSDSYFIAQSERECWKCSKLTRVYGFLLPTEHEVWEPMEAEQVEDEPEIEEGLWCRSSEQTILSYITKLAPAVAARIEAFTPYYRVDFSKTTRSSYWMNHCEQCGMKQGDYEIFEESAAAFSPVDERAASRIVLHIVNEPFSCHAGSRSLDVQLFHSMRCA